jgi:hypothetical protein
MTCIGVRAGDPERVAQGELEHLVRQMECHLSGR